MLLSGFFGLCKVVACLFFIIFLVERIGRKGALLSGSFLMGLYMLIIGIITATHPPHPKAGLTPPAIASITMIYLEASTFQIYSHLTKSSLIVIVTFNISWGPVPWVRIPQEEISTIWLIE